MTMPQLFQFGTDKQESAISTMRQKAGRRYSILLNNCAHAVNKTLESIGIVTHDYAADYLGSQITGQANLPEAVPNYMYDDMRANNKNNIVLTFKRK